MTYPTEDTLPPEVSLPPELSGLLIAQGLDALPEVIRLLVNAAMRTERERYLEARSYEQSEERAGYANGFKEKTVEIKAGNVSRITATENEAGAK